jgi:CubicO group peptidase (beta-lactamase class C family)
MTLKYLKLTSFILISTSNVNAQQTAARLDSLFQTQYRHQQLNGSVLVAREGQVIYRQAFGFRDLKNHQVNSTGTLFNLASISKTFTSTAILQLVDAGKLKLDDAFAKYFNDFPYRTITIRQLLSHTSGLPDKQDLFTDSLIKQEPDKVWQNSDIIPALQHYGKLALQPGEKWSYSNINYNLLALLIEKLSGETYTHYLQKHIFGPAGITGAYGQTSITTKPNDSSATNYAFPAPYASDLVPVKDLPGNKKWVYTLNGLVGQGGITLVAADLLRFDQALYNGKLVKARTLRIAFSPAQLNNNNYADASSSAGAAWYGLGWFIMKDTTAGKVVFHTGKVPGELNIFLRNLDRKETVIVLDNAESEGIYTTGGNAMKIMDGQAQRIRKLSAAIYYSKALFKDGPDAATAKLNQFRADTAAFELDPGEMDFMGHAFFDRGEKDKAIEVFKVNVLLYPAIWQVYNSYGAALIGIGNKTTARLIYEQALKLNPKDDEAISFLHREF